MSLQEDIDPLDIAERSSDNDDHSHRTHHWASTASLVVGAMAGAGVLGIAEAVQQSGWLGIPLLFIVAVFNIFTGIILGNVMRVMPEDKLGDYAAIGEYCFGKWGRYISLFAQYITLGGVSIIFLVLIGILMNEVVEQAPRGFFTLVIGLLLIPFLIVFRSLKEAHWSSYFAVLATLFACVVSVVVAIVFYYSSDYEKQKEQNPNKFQRHGLVEDTFASAFSVFTFAFGATALFPNLYAHMRTPNDWPKAVISSYGFAMMTMFFPVALVGYYVLGDALKGTGTIFSALTTITSDADVYVKLGAAVIVVHLLMALPIVVTPVLQKAEEIVNKRNRFVISAIVRTIIIVVFTGIGLSLPYFLPLMGVVTNASVTITSYLLPPLFYLRTERPMPWLMAGLCVITFLFGVVGSIVGLYEAFRQLIDAVKAGNPFDGLFEFDT